MLIQCALFLDHVGTEKFAAHVVDDEIKELTDRVMELLKRTGPAAEMTATLVARLVDDEGGWRKWKEDGCPSFEKPPIDFENEPMPENYDPKYSQWPPDQYPPSDPNLKYDFGNEELNRLWNLGGERRAQTADVARVFRSLRARDGSRARGRGTVQTCERPRVSLASVTPDLRRAHAPVAENRRRGIGERHSRTLGRAGSASAETREGEGGRGRGER